MTEGGRQDFSQHGASGVILRGPDSGAGRWKLGGGHFQLLRSLSWEKMMSPKYIMGKQHSVNQGNEVLGFWLLSSLWRKSSVHGVSRMMWHVALCLWEDSPSGRACSNLIKDIKCICYFDGLPNLKESVLTYNLELLNLDHRLSESCREHWCAQGSFLKPGCLFPVWCNQRSSCLCGLLPVLSWFHVSCKKENPNLI